MSNPVQVCVICGTDRPASNTLSVVQACGELLEVSGTSHSLLMLDELPMADLWAEPYEEPSEAVLALIEKHIAPAGKFVFVMPEYHGSFPGMLKVLMDVVPSRYFKGKKAALIGVSDGRAGNLRGLDHFTAILHYLQVDVVWRKPKLSKINELIDADRRLHDATSREQIREVLGLLQAF